MKKNNFLLWGAAWVIQPSRKAAKVPLLTCVLAALTFCVVFAACDTGDDPDEDDGSDIHDFTGIKTADGTTGVFYHKGTDDFYNFKMTADRNQLFINIWHRGSGSNAEAQTFTRTGGAVRETNPLMGTWTTTLAVDGTLVFTGRKLTWLRLNGDYQYDYRVEAGYKLYLTGQVNIPR